ncbi:MAG TPA: hypothetical protein VHB20_07495 [Verrucomicrobiae bacterium]|jgi:hypothetical protein|nr:hypothetical protein [Verrucomicrobiae bacterium]
MTPAQKTKYFRYWSDACRVHAWRMQKGCMVSAGPLAADSEHVHCVMSVATKLASQKHRAVTSDDIRHAVNFIATKGRELSSQRLTNKEISRVFLLLRLLIDADDLEAVNEWIHPELDVRRGLIARIGKVPGAYVAEIARDRFGSMSWENLPTDSLLKLLKLLGRRDAWNRQPFTVAEPEAVDCPF